MAYNGRNSAGMEQRGREIIQQKKNNARIALRAGREAQALNIWRSIIEDCDETQPLDTCLFFREEFSSLLFKMGRLVESQELDYYIGDYADELDLEDREYLTDAIDSRRQLPSQEEDAAELDEEAQSHIPQTRDVDRKQDNTLPTHFTSLKLQTPTQIANDQAFVNDGGQKIQSTAALSTAYLADSVSFDSVAILDHLKSEFSFSSESTSIATVSVPSPLVDTTKIDSSRV